MLLKVVVGVESPLRAALGPKPGHSWPTWGYKKNKAIALRNFLDHLVKESRRRVSIGNET